MAAGVFELRLPIPFEDGLVNVFLFTDGKHTDLLDCGMNADESLAAIKRALEHLGSRRLRRLVVTHIHPDHYGAAGIFARPRLDRESTRLNSSHRHKSYAGFCV